MVATGDDALKAWYLEPSDTTKVKVQAGQLNLVAYDKHTIKLCLVGINGAAVPEAGYVQKELNKIYSAAVVDWQVSKMNGKFEIDLQGKFEDTPSDGKMDYSDQEKKIRDAFMKSDHYNSSVTHLLTSPLEHPKHQYGYEN